jgi:hypothetical protein
VRSECVPAVHLFVPATLDDHGIVISGDAAGVGVKRFFLLINPEDANWAAVGECQPLLVSSLLPAALREEVEIGLAPISCREATI